ncbi:MAG: tetratricopeptide repeat protein [Acidobacteria bacterium]|nr:tetratricopeptide repeat protein [Acidobacteriota bacterium]
MKTFTLMILLVFFPALQPEAGLHEGKELYAKGKYSHAADAFQKLADASPSNTEVRIWLGRSYLKMRQWDRAVREMEKAVQIQPDNAYYHLWLGRACGDRASNSSFITAPGWARRVLKEFETARKLAPENLDVRFDLLEYYLEAPGIMGGGKGKAEAEAQAIAGLNSEKGYIARATIHIKNKKWDMARKELEKAVLEYPQSVSAFNDLAGFLLDRNDYEEALHYANKALLLESNSKRARLIAAAAKIRLKTDLDETAKTFQDFVAGSLRDGDPSFEEVYYWLGECFLAKGDKAKAKESFKSALIYNPEYGRAKESLSKLK